MVIIYYSKGKKDILGITHYNSGYYEDMEKPAKKLETVLKIYRKTLAYELMNCKVNEDGTCTWYHSDRYMEENPNSKREVNIDELLKKGNNIVVDTEI